MLTGRLGSYIKPKSRQGARPRKNLERRASRRAVRPGYPIEPRAFTAEECRDYIAGDRVTCLLCGKDYKSIGLHLRVIHSTTPDDYRARYGLPWSKGLAGVDTRERYAAVARKTRAECDYQASPETIRKMLAAPHRPRQPFRREITISNGLKAHGQNRRLWTDADAEGVLQRLAQGIPVARALAPVSRTWWHVYRREHPEYEARVMQTWDDLPFPVAAKAGVLGPRFVRELRALFDRGVPDYRAAAILGVTAMTCNRHTKPWRRENPSP